MELFDIKQEIVEKVGVSEAIEFQHEFLRAIAKEDVKAKGYFDQYECALDALYAAFQWSKSEKGYKYWAKVASSLLIEGEE